MSKFVGKFRQRDYFLDTEDDEYDTSRSYVKAKKRKPDNNEIKRLRLQDESYGYESRNSKKPRKFVKL